MRRENIHQRGCYFKEVSEAMPLIAVFFQSYPYKKGVFLVFRTVASMSCNTERNRNFLH